MQDSETRQCVGCNWYDSGPEDFNVGRCLLYDAVDSKKRDPHIGGVNSLDFCRYGLTVGAAITETGFTKEEIAEIVNRAPDTLLEKVTAEDISPILV